CCTPKVRAKTNVWGVPMTKYSDDLKARVVREYLEGVDGYKPLARKYGISSHSLIVEWVRVFRALGAEGLKRKKVREVYSVQFKLDVLHWMKSNRASLSETATHFGLKRRSTLATWKEIMESEGVAGLEPKPKGPLPMPKKSRKKRILPLSREEQLERENELLRLEVSYLKKRKAFQENPGAYLEKHKQRYPSSSPKKDSD
ncbi:helix-turn-helix domain-containing protein, partial [Geomicrobium sp. JSM 1781026]|uniref:helix-turn-helix domain-containing protein n=1 Tax=Geomicrobium sp. JSM 1781026 TaxID=3344580 RepID=UPI0035C0901A